jgi:hypothetical protein
MKHANKQVFGVSIACQAENRPAADVSRTGSAAEERAPRGDRRGAVTDVGGLGSGRVRSAGRFWGHRPPPAPRRGGTGLRIDCSSNVDQNKYPARTWSRGLGDRPPPANRRVDADPSRSGTPPCPACPTAAPSDLAGARDARGPRSPSAPPMEWNPDRINGPSIPWDQGTKLPTNRGTKFFSSLGPLVPWSLGPLVPWFLGSLDHGSLFGPVAGDQFDQLPRFLDPKGCHVMDVPWSLVNRGIEESKGCRLFDGA